MKIKVLKEVKMTPLVVVYFGGFKPPHKGHNAIVDEYLTQKGASKVIIMFGPTARYSEDGTVEVDGKKAYAAWKLFTQEYDNEQVEVMPIASGSPMNAAAELAWDDRFAGYRISPGYSAKEPHYGDIFMGIISSKTGEFGRPPVAMPVLVPAETNIPSISATKLRNAIASGDVSSIDQMVPSDVNSNDYYNIMREWRQHLLTELFDTSDVYDFKLTKKEEERDYAGAIYHFTAQKTPESQPYEYKVEIRGFEDEDPMWDVDFHTDSIYAYGLTGETDLKIYATIAAIVRHFAFKVRPTYSDEAFSQLEQFYGSAAREFQGDKRRVRIYAGLLRRMGASDIDVFGSQVTWKIPVE